MAHVVPQPLTAKTGVTGDENAKSKIGEVTFRLSKLRNKFISNPGGAVVYAVNAGGEAELPDQKAMFEAALEEWKLPNLPLTYEVLEPKATRFIGKGELLVDARESPPVIWFENTKHEYKFRATRGSSSGS